MPTAAAQNQTSMYETTIDDPAVEKILEERETLRQKKATAQKAFKDKTDVNSLDLGIDAPVRIGRFVVANKPVPGRVVNFQTDPTQRLQISLISEAD